MEQESILKFLDYTSLLLFSDSLNILIKILKTRVILIFLLLNKLMIYDNIYIEENA